MEYNIGDIVRTKKQHPCGSKLWEITRVGVDFKLKCLGCGHVVMVERQKALKMITKKEENNNKKMRTRVTSSHFDHYTWVNTGFKFLCISNSPFNFSTTVMT